MVKGLEIFRAHFQGFEDQYVLIGGTASYLTLNELGVDFRVTKDLDIVLCVESLNAGFGKKFWEFIRLGAYQNRQKSSEKRLFYRFYAPETAGFPEMLELFARTPDALGLSEDAHLTPIPIGDAVSSLSAILLERDYYDLIHKLKRESRGIPCIGAEALIPLKARAYLDLSERKRSGEKIDSKDIKKHKNDVFRLYHALSGATRVEVGSRVQEDLKKAFASFESELVDLRTLGIAGVTALQVVKQLKEVYGIVD
jgi:hypothetical protein